MNPQLCDTGTGTGMGTEQGGTEQALIDFEAGLISRFDLRCLLDDDQIELLQVERRHRAPLKWNGALDARKQRLEWDIAQGWGVGIRRYGRGLEQVIALDLMWISIAWAWLHEGHVSHYEDREEFSVVERLILALWGGQIVYSEMDGAVWMTLMFSSEWKMRGALGGVRTWRAIATWLSPAAKAVQPEVE